MNKKVILIIDMPSKCRECKPFCKKMNDGCNYCMVTDRIIVDIENKTHWCPLKTISEFKDNLKKEIKTLDKYRDKIVDLYAVFHKIDEVFDKEFKGE